MLSIFQKYYHTLKYLKWIQIRYQLWYRLTALVDLPNLFKGKISSVSTTKNLKFKGFISSTTSWLGTDTFRFLNIQHQFENGIDWNYSNHGKLWTYNLNYFEFLEQPNISKYEGLGLIHDFIGKEKNIKDGMESFPISLRLVFWIKFLLKNNIQDEQINQSIYRQLLQLSSKPEYHLLGNHLLENGFGLLFGGLFLNNEKILNQAKEIITEQLQEQILSDGAHFELSPMYHQLILYRILDSINLLQNNPSNLTGHLLGGLQNTASNMLGWLNNITFTNGDVPCLNDSIDGIAPNSKKLFDYVDNLQIKINQKQLSDSGYRIFSSKDIEMIMDIGKIGPDYIPGHAHSDTFNFVIQYQNQPFLVDTGISTYEKNERRKLERSTASHNTVMIEGKEQSEVWGGFRVGKRANVTILEDCKNNVRAIHDGYKKIGCHHQRTFLFKENQVRIEDLIIGKGIGIASFHFHFDIKLELGNQKIVGEFGEISFDELVEIRLENYFLATGFNQTQKAQRIKVTFENKLNTNITFI